MALVENAQRDRRSPAAMSDGYKKLVRTAMRAFYDGEVPPRPKGEVQTKANKRQIDNEALRWWSWMHSPEGLDGQR
eukprot:jgi/Pico_ML_1/54672/g51.t2